jgi:hypothetical protein
MDEAAVVMRKKGDGSQPKERISVFVLSPIALSEQKDEILRPFLVKWHNVSGPAELLYATSLRDSPPEEVEDLCHLCPGGMPGPEWCRVCGGAVCGPHAKPRLVENIEGRVLICCACVRSLKSDGKARPVLEGLLEEQDSHLRDYWLAASCKVPRTQTAQIKFAQGKVTRCCMAIGVESAAYGEVDVFFSAGEEEPACAVRDAWAGKYSVAAVINGHRFLLNFSPEFQPPCVLNQLPPEQRDN